MTENNQNIVKPLGHGMGKMGTIDEALRALAQDMIDFRDEILSDNPDDDNAAMIERYAIALLVMANQLQPAKDLPKVIYSAISQGVYVPDAWREKSKDETGGQP